MVRNKLAAAIAAIGALQAGVVNALGMGDFSLNSALNQPLDAEIKLLNTEDLDESQLLVSLANSTEFKNAGVSRDFFLTNIRFRVEMDGNGRGVIKVTTREPVIEPYLNFLVEARWPSGRLMREYTVLLDLPVFSENTVEPVKSTTSSATRSVPVPASTSSSHSTSSALPASSARRTLIEGELSAGEQYRVRNDDTLWEIAVKARPASNVSVQQTMVGIQELNPHAFINGNINQLKAGAVLRLPTERDISVSDRQAVGEVANQNKAWRSGVDNAMPDSDVQLDATAGAGDPVADSSDEPRLSIASTGDNTGSSASGGVGGGGAAALSEELAATEETLDKTQRENEELTQRLDDLESKLATMQRLLELKDDQLAALQGEVSEMPATDSESGMMDTPEDPAAMPEPMTEESEATESEATEPQAKPAPPPPVTEPSLLDKLTANPLYAGGAGLLILAAIAAALLMRRRKAEQDEEFIEYEEETDSLQDIGVGNFDEPDEIEEDEEAAEEIPDAADLLAAELEQQIAADNAAEAARVAEEEIEPAETAAGVGKTVESETGDVVAEADIYIAYGRYQQAIDLLRSAIAKEPERSDLYVKLLEVCIETRDKAGFQQQYVALKAVGDDDAENAVKEMLSTVDGVSGWLDDLPGQESAEIPTDVESLANDEDLADSNFGEEPEFTHEAAIDDSADEEIELDLDLDDIDLEADDQDLDLELDDLAGLDEDELGDVDPGAVTQESPAISLDNMDLDQADKELDTNDLNLSAEEETYKLEGYDELGDHENDEPDLDLDLELEDETDEIAADKTVQFSADDLQEQLDTSASETPVEEQGEADDSFDLDLEQDLNLSEELDLDEDLDLESLDDAELGAEFDEDLSADLSAEFGDLEETDTEQGLSETDLDAELEGLTADLESDPRAESSDAEGVDTDSLGTESAEESDELDLDLELDSIDFEETDTDSQPTVEFTREDIEQERNKSASGDDAPVEPAMDVEGEEGFDFLADTDEVATKLDLARAYIDMGDTEGARDILDEVVQEGTEQQQQEASELLGRID